MNKVYIFLLLLLAPLKLPAIEHGSTVHYPVGELGEKWQFPSDHLPVGLSIGDIHVMLWNTLNTRYIYHIHANHQGLKGSLITTANVPRDLHSRLTIREEMVIDLVLDMVYHPRTPRSLMALQEVGTEVFHELKRRLPDNMVIVTALPDDLENGDVYIYDKNRFDYISLLSDCFHIRPRNTYLTLTLQEKKTGEIYRFIQSHVPGGPVASSPARREWAEDILINFDPDAVNIVMGDMNRSPDFFLKDLNEAADDFGLDGHPFQNLWVPYPTHIDTYKRATWIDNFFVSLPRGFCPAEVEKDPGNFGESVEEACKLIRSLRNCPLEAAFELYCQLEVHQFAVFQGTCGCWTAEQLKIALSGKKYKKCDLLQLVCDSCDPNLVESEEEIVRAELEWLKTNKETLIAQCAEAECIVLDQFDLFSVSDLSWVKRQTVMEILEIAQQLHRQGKSIVLVVHQSCQASSEFWEELTNRFSFCRSNLVNQGYLTDEEEDNLLSKTLLSAEEKQLFKALTKGSPFAYVTLMDLIGKDEEQFKLGFEELCEDMMLHIEHTWSEVLTNEPSEVQSMLVEIAHDTVEIGELTGSLQFTSLLETGFIGSKDGSWIMPQVVRDFLLRMEK